MSCSLRFDEIFSLLHPSSVGSILFFFMCSSPTLPLSLSSLLLYLPLLSLLCLSFYQFGMLSRSSMLFVLLSLVSSKAMIIVIRIRRKEKERERYVSPMIDLVMLVTGECINGSKLWIADASNISTCSEATVNQQICNRDVFCAEITLCYAYALRSLLALSSISSPFS